ncbi:MAG: hypothetical protein WBP45_00835 [Daejeonella sp.]
MNPKEKIKDFVRHIETLGKRSTNRVIDEFQETEKELLNKFIADAHDLIEHNEWGTAIENLLINIYEIDFKIDIIAVDLAKAAIEECKMDYKEWKFIEGLVQEFP